MSALNSFFSRVDCVPHTQVSFAWNSDVSYMPLPWPFSFQYISHRRGGCFEANQNATLQKTSRALPALLFGQGLRATWSCNCCPVDRSNILERVVAQVLRYLHHHWTSRSTCRPCSWCCKVSSAEGKTCGRRFRWSLDRSHPVSNLGRGKNNRSHQQVPPYTCKEMFPVMLQQPFSPCWMGRQWWIQPQSRCKGSSCFHLSQPGVELSWTFSLRVLVERR